MICWQWATLGVLLVAELIKVLRVRNEHLYVLNPDNSILLASRQQNQHLWIKKTRSCAACLFKWVEATTWEFRIKLVLALLMTCATGAHRVMHEKIIEGASVYETMLAGLKATFAFLRI
jgi:hypothetical protein